MEYIVIIGVVLLISWGVRILMHASVKKRNR